MGRERSSRIVAMAAAVVAGVTLAGVREPIARADEMVFGPHDVPTVFFIGKSDDRNRVDYGIRLDASCTPVNDDALILYWREFERSPPVRTHPFSFLDYIPYGVAEQRRVRRTATGSPDGGRPPMPPGPAGEYALRLKQFDRPIMILTNKEPDGRCSATARATIGGVKAQFLSVYAKLAGVMAVEYIDLFGRDLETGAPVTERVKK